MAVRCALQPEPNCYTYQNDQNEFFQAQNAPKLVFDKGSTPDPAEEAWRFHSPSSPLEKGIPPPIFFLFGVIAALIHRTATFFFLLQIKHW